MKKKKLRGGRWGRKRRGWGRTKATERRREGEMILGKEKKKEIRVRRGKVLEE